MANEITDDDRWKAIEAFCEHNDLVHHQIASFNNFVHNKSHDVLESTKRTTINHEGQTCSFEFENLIYEHPTHTESDGETHTIYPLQNLQRTITYGSNMYVDFTVFPAGGAQPFTHQKVHIGNLPVMTMSDLCNLYEIRNDKEELARLREDIHERGGYFVVAPKADKSSGTCQRRVIVCQEKAAHNRVYIFKNRKSNPKYSLYAEVRSTNGTHMTTSLIGLLNRRITAVLPWIEAAAIPLGVLFRALGAKSEDEMVYCILGPDAKKDRKALDLLLVSLEYSYDCDTEEAALHFIGRKGKKFVKDAVGDAEEKVDLPIDEEVILEENNDNDDSQREEAQEKEENAKALAQAKMRAEAISYAKHLLTAEFLPHLGSDLRKKMFYVGYEVNKLMSVELGRKELEDRDHYKNKRTWTISALLAIVFYGALRRMISDITEIAKKMMSKGNAVNILSAIKPSTITNAFLQAICNNAWGTRNGSSQGISQLYEQFNYAAALANLRKSSIPMAREGGKIIDPRDVHGSHFGGACIAETPEGKRVGLLKNFALSALISIGTDDAAIRKLLRLMKDIIFIEDFDDFGEAMRYTRIFVNGDWIASAARPKEVCSEFRTLRRNGDLEADTSIAYNEEFKEIRIYTEPGRLMRPLLVVESGKLALKKKHIDMIVSGEMTWAEMLSGGFAELIDKEEEEELLIAGHVTELTDEKFRDQWGLFTHCEMHPSLMYGIGGSLIPFPDRNQSPRNCYQAAMGKQAIGMAFANFRHVLHGIIHNMDYLQRPLVMSRASSIVGYDQMPAGQNAMVVIMPFKYNEEDGIEMCQTSIDFGFMRSTKFITCYAEARADRKEEFAIPSETTCGNFKKVIFDISKLEEDAVIGQGQRVVKNDILIGRIVGTDAATSVHSFPYTNSSIVYEHELPGVVDSVQRGITGDGYPYVRVLIAQKREPIVADKFSARHGQKGTIGHKYDRIDLPFNRDGINPDLVVNSLAFPSRMTIAMLVEALTGKKAASDMTIHNMYIEDVVAKNEQFNTMFSNPKHPQLIDGTPFRDTSLDVIRRELNTMGLEGCGDEQMMDGTTGLPLRCLTFFAPVYYQKLRHMVVDKVHARASGGKTVISHQPCEGRSRGGGLRVNYSCPKVRN
jgi:DNA-directed RNA polymerase II subunit RPB2